MPEIGQNLSHYNLVGKIGKGGMGEVFRAKDQKLGRDVAIKVLPEEFARDTDRVARFEREAKLLASLNHPNIAAIHGLEESDGTHFLVLELVEGDTLSDRIKAGPIPVEEALKFALQIAEALEAAHEKGVIHRDLKPSNIKVTPEGKVKVLDFGLAKAFAGEQEDMILSDSPTISAAATQKGVILGTAAYMSPEQARGKSVDKRADIWAFGCVLFEMLTGRAAFSGKDVTDILAAVIRSEPEWSSLPANLHGRLREVLERCLEKDAKDRYSGINDARVDIQKVMTDPSGVFVQPIAAAESQAKLRQIFPWIVSAVVLAAIIAGVAIWILKPTPPTEPRQVNRFYYELPEDQTFTRGGLGVSADGTKIAYIANQQLHLKNFDELDARPIPGTNEDLSGAFFSPDGQWIWYYSVAGRQFKKISISGGVPVVLCDVAGVPTGGSWSSDNILVWSQIPGGIMRVSADGGTPESLIKAEREYFFNPKILPDGQTVLFAVRGQVLNAETSQIVVQSLESGERKVLFAGVDAWYLSTGHLVYLLANNSLFAVPFDLETLAVAGGPVSLLEGVAGPSISDSGTLVYYPVATSSGASGDTAGRTLVWVDMDGKEEPLGAASNRYLMPKISPDGSGVALAINAENIDIWIWDLARKTMTRLTFDKGIDYMPIWTPDSKQILFWSEREGKFGAIFQKKADGTGEVEMLAADPDRQLFPSALSGDGKTLIVADTTDVWTKADISMLLMEGDHKRTPLLQDDAYVEAQPSLSPDGKWIAYFSNESGRNEIYVRSFPDMNKGRWQVSTNGGITPLWAPNGRELYYLSVDDASVMAVAVETGTAFSAATPKKLFPLSPYDVGIQTWDIHPDGKRFLMMKLPETTEGESQAEESAAEPPRKIIIVTNWFEELKERVPVD